MNGQQFAEALALCAGKCGLPNLRPGGGDYNCQDLLMALAKAEVPDLARRLVRWRCMDDPGEQGATTAALRAYFPLPDALIGSAIWEWLAPAICLTCCGGQHRYATQAACPACGGTGMATKRHAPPGGLTVEVWRTYERDYQRMLDELADLTRTACVRAAALLTEKSLDEVAEYD